MTCLLPTSSATYDRSSVGQHPVRLAQPKLERGFVEHWNSAFTHRSLNRAQVIRSFLDNGKFTFCIRHSGSQIGELTFCRPSAPSTLFDSLVVNRLPVELPPATAAYQLHTVCTGACVHLRSVLARAWCSRINWENAVISRIIIEWRQQSIECWQRWLARVIKWNTCVMTLYRRSGSSSGFDFNTPRWGGGDHWQYDVVRKLFIADRYNYGKPNCKTTT